MLTGGLLALTIGLQSASRIVEPVTLAEAAGSATIEHTTHGGGILRGWVESADFDAVLVLQDEHGTQLSEDDDTGGVPAPWIDAAIEAGRSTRFVVRSKNAAGAARLVIVELPESAADRADASAARAELDAAIAGMTTNEARVHREALSALTARWTAHPHLAVSDALQIVLIDAISALSRAGDQPGVIAATERLVDIQRDILPPDSRRRLVAVLQHGAALGQVGRAGDAIESVRETVAVCRRTLAHSDRARWSAESTLGALLFAIGDVRGAMEGWNAALRGSSLILGEDAVDLAQLRANLAVGAFYLGDLERARVYVDEARSRGAQIIAGTSLDLQLRGARSAIVTEQGDHATGRILAEEARDSARANYPADHATVAITELNFAIAQVRAGENDAARATITRILATPQPELAPNHPLIVQARLNLAAIDLIQNDPESAENELAILTEQLDGPVDPTQPLARAILRNRALALRGLRRLEEAADVESELLAAVRAVLPPDHPERLGCEFQCAGTDASRERNAEARAGADDAARALLAMLASRALILSPREAEASARSSGALLDTAFELLLDPDLAAVRPGAEALAFELGETARGIGVAAARSLRAVEAGGAEARDLRESARQAQMDLVRAARAAGPEALSRAVEARDAAERALRLRLGTAHSLPRSISFTDVVRRLAPDEAAVGWRVRVRDAGGDPWQFESEEVLSAVLVRSTGSIAWIDLGPLAPIDAACRAWRAELERVPFDRDAARTTGERVRALVVDPVRARATDARRWAVAPDGPLLSLPLDALPDARDGGDLLGDHVSLRTVWSFDTEPAPAARNLASSLLVVGDPEFGTPPKDVAPRWSALPATAREIEAVASIWRTRHGDAEVARVLRGRDAGAPELARHATAARWLHVATHGSFDEDEAPGSLLTATGEARPTDFARSVRALVPMVRCELVLAGANVDADATLTAEELGALDLSGCELAVLSACDTGRGEIVTGQGVASFQRALVAAGARHCVTSLWRVPDEATRELMTVFYRGLWEGGLAPGEALWRAKKTLRDRRAPPRDWAAWVLASSFSE